MNNRSFIRKILKSLAALLGTLFIVHLGVRNTHAQSVTYSVHAVTDRSGTPNTSSPGNPRGATGYTTGTFNVGQIIRVTMKAVNTSTSTGAYAMINIRNPSDTTVYRSPGGTTTALPSGAVGNSVDSPLTLNETDYYSFDINTAGWPTGSYDISGTFRSSSTSNTIIDSTVSGANTPDVTNTDWWRLNQFTLQSPQPLPTPSLSTAGITGTTATLNWTWGGDTTNATALLLSLVRTNGLNGSSISPALITSQSLNISQLTAALHTLSGNQLEPGLYYRANIAYSPGAGFSGGGSNSIAFQTTPLAVPSSLSRTLGTSNVSFGWGNVPSATMYRLQVKKSTASYPADDTASATADVPVNYLISGQNWFTWSDPASTSSQIYGPPINGQAYTWRVKSVYSGLSFSNFTTTAPDFTYIANQAPTVTSATATLLADGRLEVKVTGNDDSSTSLGCDLYLSETGNLNSFNPSSKKTVGPLTRNVQSTFYYSAAELASLCISGNNYRLRANVYDSGTPQLGGLGYSGSFLYAAVSPPSGMVANSQNMNVNFTWSPASGALLYRLQVRKAGQAWPATDESNATDAVPVNVLLTGNGSTSFSWAWSPSWSASSSVFKLPIPSQQYEWRVKAAYNGTIGATNWTGTAGNYNFTQPANALPNITGSSATSSNGNVTVNFTPTDTQDSQLRYDLHIYNAAGTAVVGTGFGHQQWYAAANGIPQTFTWTANNLGTSLTAGQTYNVKISLFDPAFDANGTNFRTLLVPFTYGVSVPNPLGVDTYLLDGKKVGGLTYISGNAVEAPGGLGWKMFQLRQGTTVVAQAAGDVASLSPETAYLIWRKPNGQLAPRWTDLFNTAGPFTLKMVGISASGTEVESAPFTFTLQTAASLTISSPEVFPRYQRVNPPAATTINAVATGTSGTTTLSWSNPMVTTTGTTGSVSTVINTPGLNLIRCVAKDTSGNRIVEAFVAPVAVRDRVGNNQTATSMEFQGVDVTSGNFHLPSVDMAMPAIGVPFSLERSYNSYPATVFDPTIIPSVGRWIFGFEQSLNHSHVNSQEDIYFRYPTVNVYRADGSAIQFFPGMDGYYHPTTPGNHDMLVEDFNAGTFTLYQAATPPLVTVFETTDQNKRANSTYRLKSIKNLRGHGLTVNYTTSTGTKISTVTDQSNRVYTFYYTDADAPTRISRVSDFSGRNVYYDWDGNGNILTFTDVRGYTTTYGYGASGNEARRLQYIQLPEGNRPVSSIVYDTARRVQSMTMPMATDSTGASTSATTTFSYLSTHTDIDRPGTGADIRYETDLDRNVLAVIESYGVANRRTDFLRISPSDLAGKSNRTSDLGLMTRATTQNLTPTQISYSENGRGLVRQVSDGTGTTAVNYPSSVLNAAPGTLPQNLALPTSVIDKRGKTYTPAYTGFGELTSFLNPYFQGDRITQYDSATGLPKYSVTQRNNSTDYTTEFVYTTTGDLWKVIVPPDPDNTNREIVFGYPSGSANRGLPITITDRKGYVTTIEWDTAGQPLKIWADPSLPLLSGERRDIVMAYDMNGNRNAVTNRRNQTTHIDFDAMGRPWRVRQPSPDGSAARPTTIQEFDTLGRPTIATNPNGNRQRVVYGTSGNAGGLPQTQQVWNNSAWETVSTTAYLSDGRTQSVTDGVGIASNYSYMPSPRQHLVYRITQAAPGGYTTYREFDYDASEAVIMSKLGSTDPSIAKPLPAQLLEYDDASRVRRVCDVMDGDTSAAAWSKSGNIITSVTYYGDDQIDTITDPRSKAVKHIYNSLGNLATRRDPLGSEWLYRYDANGNLREEVFPGNGSYPSRTITRTWGVLDRLLTVNYGDGLNTNVTYTYDAEGNRRSLTDRQSSTTYGYDNLDRLIALSHTPNGRPALSLGYSYLPAGQLQTMTYPGSRTVNYSYDHGDRMKTVTPWVGGAFTYAWRVNGQLDSLTNPNGTATDYQYESSNGRLSRLLTTRGATTIADQQFTYDPAGNITRILGDLPTPPPSDNTLVMTPDDANRLSTLAGAAVTNDPAGRSRSLPAPVNGTATWEGMDWLSSWTSGGQTSSYGYNGDGVRTHRTTPTGTIRYLVSPNGHMPNVVAESTDANSPQRFYIHGLGLLASIDTSNNALIYHPNHRGDILALTNPSGSVTESYGYSPFGLTAASNPTSTNPFRFGGALGVMDEGNGLNFMRARYYNASVGRFLSMDQLPGGIEIPQSLDRFAYALGNPLSNVDPSGRTYEEIVALIKKVNSVNSTTAANYAASLIDADASLVDQAMDSAADIIAAQMRNLLGIEASPALAALAKGKEMYDGSKMLLSFVASYNSTTLTNLRTALSNWSEFSSFTTEGTIHDYVIKMTNKGFGLSKKQRFALEQIIYTAYAEQIADDPNKEALLNQAKQGMITRKKRWGFWHYYEK